MDPDRFDVDVVADASSEAGRVDRSGDRSILLVPRGSLAALRRRENHAVLLGVDPERRDAAEPAAAAASRIAFAIPRLGGPARAPRTPRRSWLELARRSIVPGVRPPTPHFARRRRHTTHAPLDRAALAD